MTKHYIFSFLFLISASLLQAQLLINEVCSSNDQSYVDSHGDSPDWIELYNASNEPIQLKDYYISDNLDYSYKWQFPSTIIEAGAYLLIIADGSNNKDELRTSFKLSKLGEEICLRTPDNQLVDHVIFPKLKSDVSYGRVNGTLQYLTPSPLSANSESDIYNILSIPTPSISGGVYQSDITLDFTSEGNVHYKLNNRSKKNELIYDNEAIKLSETTVVCYWAEADDLLDSPVQCETYFIDIDHSLPLLSVVGDSIDLFSYEEGIFEFGPNAEAEWPYYGANFWSHEEKPVHFQYYINGEKVYEEDAALQMHGGRESRTNPARSFRMVANKYADQRFEFPFYSNKPQLAAVKKIVVRNSSGDFNAAHLRDGFLSKQITLNDLDIDALGYEPVVCYLNGKYFGVMGLREKADEYYINQNFGLPLNTFSVVDVDTAVVHGSSQDFIKMHDFIWQNDMSDPINYMQAENLLDVDSYIDYFAFELGLNNKAWPQHNIRFWKSDINEGKWRYILYDMDIAMYRYSWTKYDFDLLGTKMVEYADTNKHINILKSLMKNPRFRQKYCNRHQDLFNTLLETDRFKAELDKMVDILEPEMPRQFDTYPIGSYEEWHDYHLARIREYMELRPYYARLYMDQYFNLGGEAKIEITSTHGEDIIINLNTLKNISLPFTGYYFQGVDIELESSTDRQDIIFDHWEITRGTDIIIHRINNTQLHILDNDKIKAVYKPRNSSAIIQNIVIVGNQIIFQSNALNESKVDFNIYSIDGKSILRRDDILMLNGQNHISIPSLMAGVYVVSISNDTIDFTAPVSIIQR